jgi:hypothetical protein
MTAAKQTAQISALNPSSGTPSGGFELDISGVYLENADYVNWGTQQIARKDLDVDRGGKLVAIKSVPSGHPDTVVHVSVHTPDSGLSNVINFTYDDE